ncbi:MAG: terminase small subunit [Rhodoferax sp.]|nr:terminase small subunit [Rhodoferax sp.]
MDNQHSLSPRQERFALAYVQHHNASLACREAGYSAGCASVTAVRLLRNDSISRRIQALEATAAQELGVTRQRFLNGLLEAVELAKEKGEPMAMVAAWREIGKACGFYQAERVKVDVNVAGSLEIGRMNQLSDGELLSIIGSNQAVAQ